MTKGKKIIIYLFILAVVALYIFIYVVPSVTGALTKTTILQYGTLQVTDDVTCYVVRNEKVYSASNSGSISYYIQDGTLVRKGTQILSVTPSGADEEESKYTDIITRLGDGAIVSSTYLTEFKGIVSYYVDGYEAVFSPDNIKNLSYDEVRNYKIATENMVRNSTLKNEPLYKICDNSSWQIVCFVKSGNISKYELNKKVTINFPLGPISATITDITADGDMWRVVLTTNKYYESFAEMRKQDVSIVTSDYSGIIISNESITTSGSAIGVYVASKSGDYNFTPVKIITSDGDNSLAEVSYYYDDDGNKVSTVEIYDEILRKP